METDIDDVNWKKLFAPPAQVKSSNLPKNGPLPKLKIRRSQNRLISELSGEPPTRTSLRKNDVISTSDVIDLCEDDPVEVVSIQQASSKKKSSNMTMLKFSNMSNGDLPFMSTLS